MAITPQVVHGNIILTHWLENIGDEWIPTNIIWSSIAVPKVCHGNSVHKTDFGNNSQVKKSRHETMYPPL